MNTEPHLCERAKSSVNGFTLVELLAVIAVMLLMLKLMLPSIEGLMGGDANGLARTQLIGDLNRARTMAMDTGGAVHVVFFPRFDDLRIEGAAGDQAKIDYFESTESLKHLVSNMQLSGYALYQSRQPGDHPRQPNPKWLTDWKRLPDGFHIPREVVRVLPDRVRATFLKNGEPEFQLGVAGRRGVFVLPALKFNSRGEVDGAGVKGCYMCVSKGGVLPPDIESGTYVADAPQLDDIPASERLWLKVNGVTGRAEVDELSFKESESGDEEATVDRLSSTRSYQVLIHATGRFIENGGQGAGVNSYRNSIMADLGLMPNPNWPGGRVRVGVEGVRVSGNRYRLTWSDNIPIPAFMGLRAEGAVELGEELRRRDPLIGITIGLQPR